MTSYTSDYSNYLPNTPPFIPAAGTDRLLATNERAREKGCEGDDYESLLVSRSAGGKEALSPHHHGGSMPMPMAGARAVSRNSSGSGAPSTTSTGTLHKTAMATHRGDDGDEASHFRSDDKDDDDEHSDESSYYESDEDGGGTDEVRIDVGQVARKLNIAVGSISQKIALATTTTTTTSTGSKNDNTGTSTPSTFMQRLAGKLSAFGGNGGISHVGATSGVNSSTPLLSSSAPLGSSSTAAGAANSEVQSQQHKKLEERDTNDDDDDDLKKSPAAPPIVLTAVSVPIRMANGSGNTSGGGAVVGVADGVLVTEEVVPSFRIRRSVRLTQEQEERNTNLDEDEDDEGGEGVGGKTRESEQKACLMSTSESKSMQRSRESSVLPLSASYAVNVEEEGLLFKKKNKSTSDKNNNTSNTTTTTTTNNNGKLAQSPTTTTAAASTPSTSFSLFNRNAKQRHFKLVRTDDTTSDEGGSEGEEKDNNGDYLVGGRRTNTARGFSTNNVVKGRECSEEGAAGVGMSREGTNESNFVASSSSYSSMAPMRLGSSGYGLQNAPDTRPLPPRTSTFGGGSSLPSPSCFSAGLESSSPSFASSFATGNLLQRRGPYYGNSNKNNTTNNNTNLADSTDGSSSTPGALGAYDDGTTTNMNNKNKKSKKAGTYVAVLVDDRDNKKKSSSSFSYFSRVGSGQGADDTVDDDADYDEEAAANDELVRRNTHINTTTLSSNAAGGTAADLTPTSKRGTAMAANKTDKTMGGLPLSSSSSPTADKDKQGGQEGPLLSPTSTSSTAHSLQAPPMASSFVEGGGMMGSGSALSDDGRSASGLSFYSSRQASSIGGFLDSSEGGQQRRRGRNGGGAGANKKENEDPNVITDKAKRRELLNKVEKEYILKTSYQPVYQKKAGGGGGNDNGDDNGADDNNSENGGLYRRSSRGSTLLLPSSGGRSGGSASALYFPRQSSLSVASTPSATGTGTEVAGPPSFVGSARLSYLLPSSQQQQKQKRSSKLAGSSENAPYDDTDRKEINSGRTTNDVIVGGEGDRSAHDNKANANDDDGTLSLDIVAADDTGIGGGGGIGGGLEAVTYLSLLKERKTGDVFVSVKRASTVLFTSASSNGEDWANNTTNNNKGGGAPFSAGGGNQQSSLAERIRAIYNHADKRYDDEDEDEDDSATKGPEGEVGAEKLGKGGSKSHKVEEGGAEYDEFGVRIHRYGEDLVSPTGGVLKKTAIANTDFNRTNNKNKKKSVSMSAAASGGGGGVLAGSSKKDSGAMQQKSAHVHFPENVIRKVDFIQQSKSEVVMRVEYNRPPMAFFGAILAAIGQSAAWVMTAKSAYSPEDRNGEGDPTNNTNTTAALYSGSSEAFFAETSLNSTTNFAMNLAGRLINRAVRGGGVGYEGPEDDDDDDEEGHNSGGGWISLSRAIAFALLIAFGSALCLHILFALIRRNPTRLERLSFQHPHHMKKLSICVGFGTLGLLLMSASFMINVSAINLVFFTAWPLVLSYFWYVYKERALSIIDLAGVFAVVSGTVVLIIGEFLRKTDEEDKGYRGPIACVAALFAAGFQTVAWNYEKQARRYFSNVTVMVIQLFLVTGLVGAIAAGLGVFSKPFGPDHVVLNNQSSTTVKWILGASGTMALSLALLHISAVYFDTISTMGFLSLSGLLALLLYEPFGDLPLIGKMYRYSGAGVTAVGCVGLLVSSFVSRRHVELVFSLPKSSSPSSPPTSSQATGGNQKKRTQQQQKQQDGLGPNQKQTTSSSVPVSGVGPANTNVNSSASQPDASALSSTSHVTAPEKGGDDANNKISNNLPTTIIATVTSNSGRDVSNKGSSSPASAAPDFLMNTVPPTPNNPTPQHSMRSRGMSVGDGSELGEVIIAGQLS